MDVFTHFLLPYAAALAFLGLHRAKGNGLSAADEAVWERRAALALAFGLAGFAPDMDGMLSWLRRYPGLYFMQHRGASHSLLGAPLFGLLAVGIMALLARMFPLRLALFRWRAAFVPVAIVGSWTHLVLDGLTYGGIPLWWPFADGRPSFMFYHWIVDWLFPIGLVATLLHVFRVVDRRAMVRFAAFLVVALVALGSVQVALRPHPDEPGALVFSRGSLGEYTVLFPTEDGWVGRLWSDGRYQGFMPFREEILPGSEEALRQARDTDAYRGFRMGSIGPIVVQTEGDADTGWSVTFYDVAQRFEAAMNPSWTPTTDDWRGGGKHEWGHLELSISGAGVLRVESWGW